MVQNPKGGGLSSSLGGGSSQQIGGVKKTTDFLDKSTWTLAGVMLVLILLSNVAINRGSGTLESKALDTETTAQPLPITAPAAPATTPVTPTEDAAE